MRRGCLHLRLLLALPLLGCAVVAAPAPAAAPVSRTTPRVTLTLRHVRWLDAVDRVFGAAGASYAMDAETYANGARVWVSRTWRGVPLLTAVRDLVHRLPTATRPRLRQADGVTYLTSRRTADGVSFAWGAPPSAAAGRRSYDLTGVPVFQAIEHVLGSLPYAVRFGGVSPSGTRVTLHLPAATRYEAIEALCHAADPPFEHKLIGGGSVAALWPASEGEPAQTQERRRVTVVARDANVRYVLGATLAAAQVNYAMDAMVQGQLTVVLRDLPLGAAIDAIDTISCTGARRRIENGIWVIYVPEPAAPGAPGKPAR